MNLSYIILLYLLSSGFFFLAAGEVFEYTLPNYEYQQFANGFEIIMVENHTNPLIATVVITRTGLRNETKENNGVSHMLEHLTFNGTQRRTQKELYDELDYYGIYLNAQTSEDYTSYMALHHKDYLNQALDIMSDMLFHSTFPEEKFEKEKGIIVEEIRRDSENPDYQTELALRQDFYKNPPYSLPVIGTIETVQNMSRKQVVDYYSSYYSPGNMIALVVGDFNKTELLEYLKKYFGSVPGKNIPQRSIQFKQNYPYFYQQETDKKRTLYLKVPAPTFYAESFIPYFFFQSFALDGQTGKIIQGLKNNSELKIEDIQSTYEFHPEFGGLTLRIDFAKEIKAADVKNAVLQEFERLGTLKMGGEEIDASKQSQAIAEILQTDKILYYGFLKAQELAISGKEAFEKIIPAILQIKAEKINQFIQSYPSNWAEPERLYTSSNWPAQTSISKYQKKTATAVKAESRLYQHTLENGLKVILLQNSDNQVLALHFLFKNRAAWEPPEQTGIADFLHHSLFLSSGNFPAELLKIELKKIGAEIKTHDWDFIPYDDYYNVPEYSYIRILTLDQFLERTLEITLDNILSPALAENFENVKKQMTSLVERQQNNANQTARLKFLSMMYGENHPLTRPVSGNLQTLGSLRLEDLQAFHKEYFTAGNTILSIVSSLDSAMVFAAVEKYFGQMPAIPQKIEIPPIPETSDSASDSIEIGSQQAYIYWGYTFSGEKELEIPLRVMNDMLSNQITFSLREKKGWAYRLGSIIDSWKDHFSFYVTIGTGRETTFPVIEGIKQEIQFFKSSPVDSHLLAQTKNSMRGGLVRRRASRETQAFTLGINEFYGYPANYFFSIYDRIKTVTPEQVLQLKNDILQTDKYWLVYTIPQSQPGEKEMMPGMPKKMPH
jgi:zinc protease